MSCKSSCKTLGASKLRQKIDIEEMTKVADDTGGFTETWSVFKSVWSNITPKKSYEKWIGSQTTEVTTHKIIIRYLTGVKSEMRIKYEDRYFYIKGHINNDERKRFMTIEAKEGVGE